MSRFSAPANATAASGMHVPYVLFADFDFVSGHVRLCSADRAISFEGNTYEGIGKLAGIGPIKETANVFSQKLDFTLSGVDNSLIGVTLTEKYHNRSASLYVGYLNEAMDSMVATPHLLWEGNMDVMAVHADEGSATISLTCENRLVLWNKSCGLLYTDEHQKLIDPTDDFFNQVARLASKVVKWGGQTFVEPGGPGGGGGRGRRYTP